MINLTGLWIGKTKEGDQYLSGNLSSRVKLLIFKNKKKKKDSDPDWVACIAPIEPKEKKEQVAQDQFNENVPF